MSKKAIFILIPLLLLVAAPGVYFYSKYQKVNIELKKLSPQSKEEIGSLIKKVGMLMDLPTDEEPTVATVTDKEKLKEQKFFAKAENEDRVIIYVKAQKAILYRPAWNKIIEVARVDSIDQNQAGVATESAVATVTPTISTVVPVSLVVMNGTEETGLSSVFVERIKSLEGLNITRKLNAAKKDRVENLVVDLENGKNTELAQKILNILGSGSVTTQMPEGEATPSSQLVVLLGSGFSK